MNVTVTWFDGKYPSFNLNFHRAEGEEAFLSIKGCRIASGSKGEFISMPSTKNENTGKYWNHAWADEKFMGHVLGLAKKSQPNSASVPAQSTQNSSSSRNSGGALPTDFEDDIPFAPHDCRLV